MTYKTGEVPQIGDAVMGLINSAPARAAVIGIHEEGQILLQRRAPYEGLQKPLKVEYNKVASEDFSLVYRHEAAKEEAAPAKAAPAAKGRAKK